MCGGCIVWVPTIVSVGVSVCGRALEERDRGRKRDDRERDGRG